MPRRLWLGVAMLAAGGALLVTASFAAPARNGGIFKLAVVGSGDTLDPQVTYNTLTWSFEYATAAKLVNFPDKRGAAGARIVPEVARSYTISKDGKTYTFFIRRGFRFSDGTRVTAKNFAYAFKRVLSPRIQSPGVSFITDPAGADLTSYRAKGRRFVVKLAKPYGPFLSYMTMPFFQAASTKLPMEPVGSGPIQSAGPYFVKSTDPNTRTEISRNPYYRGSRPHHLSGVTAFYNQNLEAAWRDIDHHFDERPIPPDQVQSVGSRFGVNKTRFWVKPAPCTGFAVFNTDHGLFARNLPMRKAVSWALDRMNYAAAPGAYAASPWTHLLPPGSPGSVMKRKLQPFSAHANYAKARRLAAGHFRNGRIRLVYRGSGITGPKQKDSVVHDLVKLGFKLENIKLLGYPGWEPNFNRDWWDMVISIGWCQDYPDPYDYFKLFLGPRDSFEPMRPVARKWVRRIQAAAKITGPSRLRAFGKLDLAFVTKYAPIAALRTYNKLFFFSNRIAPRSLVYSGPYSDFDLTRIRLK
jgi:ABC-type oligopeptide transport system substrate-binding subunit